MQTRPLTAVFDTTGPFATVFVDISQDSADGAHRREVRVDDALRELQEQGAPEAVAETVRARLMEPVDVPAPAARLVVAAGEHIVFDDVVAERLDSDLTAWAPLPDLAGWLTIQDSFVPFALVVADREGSDIEIYRSSAPNPSDTTEVHGDTLHIHKVPAGNWSQDHMQSATEQVWRRNAAQTAEQIETLVNNTVELVVLAGDERARGQIKQSLSKRATERLVETEAGGRAAGASRESLLEAVTDVLRGQVVDTRVEHVHTYQDRRGQQSGVATGTDEVIDAFVRGQVDTLLLDPQGAHEVSVRPADHPGLDVGVEGADDLRGDQALVAAAVRTGAKVVVVPEASLGGEPVAALLRWDQ